MINTMQIASWQQFKGNYMAMLYARLRSLSLIVGSFFLFYVLTRVSESWGLTFITTLLNFGLLVPLLVLIFTYDYWVRLKKLMPDRVRFWIFPLKFTNKKIFIVMLLNSFSYTSLFLLGNVIGVVYATSKDMFQIVLMLSILLIPYLILNALLSLLMAAIIYFRNK